MVKIIVRFRWLVVLIILVFCIELLGWIIVLVLVLVNVLILLVKGKKVLEDMDELMVSVCGRFSILVMFLDLCLLMWVLFMWFIWFVLMLMVVMFLV